MSGTLDNTSNRYHAAKYRKGDTIQAEENMDDFVSFLRYDYEDEPTKEQMELLQKWITAFHGYDITKAAIGEAEMLERWKAANAND